ncbi:MAG TPA: DUF3073 domain-containing protein [Actinotalea caeni]|uniref:DUF3073 domain-containing protein n=1 Tax=Actinotalea caeni TaxID=1348467 RepID=UPI0012E316A4|nr:DUF3073 domain-containing protein [Actinotalea caeni]HLV56753.1 DUF3073 domain-containing protein [Actinotalea caeni]
MGRGRQKAKQTKVARQLKYYSPQTDLSALERELAASGGSDDRWEIPPAQDEDDDDWREASGR